MPYNALITGVSFCVQCICSLYTQLKTEDIASNIPPTTSIKPSKKDSKKRAIISITVSPEETLGTPNPRMAEASTAPA